MMIHPQDFDIRKLPLQTKGRTQMAVAPRPDGGVWSLPVIYVTGRDTGPILVVTAAVHGNELEGVRAMPGILAHLDPQHMQGTLVMVPVSNMPAFEACCRESPVDGLNLARVCPGSPTGTVTERIAHVLCSRLIQHADFFIDLHSGGPDMDIATLVGYIHEDTPAGRLSLAAGQAFGVPVLWGHPPPVPPGRTISAAHAAHIPCLYTETPGGGRAGIAAVDIYVQGVLNVMALLEMRAGLRRVSPAIHHLWGDGNLDHLIAAPCAGLFESETALLAEVATGQRIGVIRDVWGWIQEEVVSNRDGILLLLRNTPTVNAGDGVAFVTGRYADA